MAITYHAGRRIQGLSTDTTSTFTSDLSSSTGWTTSDSGAIAVDTSNEDISWTVSRGSNDSISYDLGSVMSNTEWVLRFRTRWTTIGGQSATNQQWFGLSSANSSVDSQTAQYFIGFMTSKFSSTTQFRSIESYNSGAVTASGDYGSTPTRSANTWYYYEIKRTSATTFELSVSSTDEYTKDIIGAQSITITSSLINLRYIKMFNENAGTGNDGTASETKDFQFNNNTTSITTTTGDTKPTNVQAGSRYEETDTRKMYHYTAPQAATDDIFSTGTGWSGDTSTYPYNSTINGIGCDTSTLGEAVTKTVTTLSASGQWVLRFKVTRETGDLGDGVMINLGSSSASTSSLARMQNGNGLYPYGIHLIYFSNGNTVNAGGSHNASFAWDSSSTTSVTWSVGDSRWIEVSHPSSSAFTTKVYSNANFTGTADLTNVASTSGQTLNYDDITIGTKWTANRKHIDFEDMQIWNGVTTAPSTSNTWEEEGT
jgi:hypothetical protein